MGEIKQGILGGFSGKVGTVVGSSWKNVSYMRALALSVSNPRTPKQQNQRGKLAKSMVFLRSIVAYVRVGYSLYNKTTSPFNAAMSYILRHGITGEMPHLAVDYGRVLVARGTLMPVFDAAAVLADGQLTLTWTDNSLMGDALPTDLAMPLVYNKKRGEAFYELEAASRADGTAELTLPSEWADDPIVVYLAFRSEDGLRVTNSLCLKNDAYEGDGGNGGSTEGGSGGDTTPGGGGDESFG